MLTHRHLRQVIDSAIDFAVVTTDLTGIVTDWSAGAENVLGWRREEVVGDSAARIFTAEDRAAGRLREEMRLALVHDRASDERWHLRKDGSRFWASGELMPLRGDDGAHLGYVKIVRDRTLQHEAGLRLRESQDRFRTLLDTIETAFAIVEVKFDADDRPVDYRFIEANPAFERQAGVNLRGKWVTEFAPDLERFWFETYGRVALTGEPAAFENYARAFGRWFDVRAIRVGDPDERQIAILFNDITARRQLQLRNAATQELSDRLRDLTEPRDIAATAAEILGTTLGASLVGYGTVDAAAETVAVERDWSVGGLRSLPQLIRLRDYGRYADDLHRGGTVVVADAALDARTAAFAAELEAIGARAFVNLPVFEHGRFVALLYVGQAEARAWTDDEVSFLRDVAERVRAATERARGEEDLRMSEARARENAERVQLALAAGAIIGTWHWDLPSDRFTVDEAFAASFGLDPALGREGIPLARIVDTVHPDDQAGLAAAIGEVIARGGPYAHQYRTRRADGNYYWLEANGRVDHAPDGTPLRFPGVLLDVEERRAAEAERLRATEALRSLNETLEQRVLERTTELMRTEEALRQSQKMEAVGQLTGGVAHDFNNLLTIIRSSVDFLRRPDLPEARKQRYLDAVSDTVDRAAKLTGQLLAFARRQALRPETFDVGAKLRGVGDMLDTVTGARIRVVIEVPDRPCYVRADLSQFETALVNMAVNARDAMDGEGRLTLRLDCAARLPAIRGHAGSPSPFAAVTVGDTGAGIPEDQLGRIFEPFFTTKAVGKGTGLGLSQVFGFAKQSGGDVDVASRVGRGTTFTLYLPEEGAGPAEAAAEQAGPPPAPAGAGQRVLVVEDNVEVGRFCTQILDDLGYATAWAANAEEALDRLGADGAGFDVVFSDVVMPGMGGLALAQALRARLPGLPVVLASGYSHVLAQEADHGFELLHKPYSAEQLARVLQRVTARSAASRGRDGPR